MGYYDKQEAQECGVEKLPDGNFVIPIVNGRNAGKWLMRYEFMGGGGSTSGVVDNEQDAWDRINGRLDADRRAWREKVIWRLQGDISGDERRPQLSIAQEAVVGERRQHGETPVVEYIINGGPLPDVASTRGRRNVLRHDGAHYVVRTFGVDTKNRDCKGFGGRLFRWTWLDDPEKVINESNDVFWQGEIPDEFRDVLPDNVEWVGSNYAVPTRMF
jgi:hypothetical protein